MSTAVEPLRIPHFRALWVATVFSAMGTFLQAVAGSWLMLELTGSATWVGLMVASALLPTLFFALLAGAVADPKLLSAERLGQAVSDPGIRCDRDHEPEAF